MNLVKTHSFELAVLSEGNSNSEKMIICLPGRLDTKDYVCFTSHLKYFSEKGYFAVSFDPPGTGESPGGTELFTTTNYIKATNELIEYFGNKHTVLLGHSRGGQVSILLGASNPHVEGLILVNSSYGPPTPPDPQEIQDNGVVDYRDLPPGGEKTAEQRKFLLPLNYFEDGQKYDPLPALKTCTKPKLLFYSTNDEFMDPDEIKNIYQTLPQPKTIHELKSDHDYRYHPEIIEEVNRVAGEFLDKYFSL